MKLKIDGKKVNGICVVAIIINAALSYFGIMPLWVTIISSEAFLALMALRSTAKKFDVKLEAINRKEFTVIPDKGVHRFIKH